MDPSQSLSHLRRKLQADSANRRTSPSIPRSFQGPTILPPPAYTPTSVSAQQPSAAHIDPYADDEGDEDGCYYPPQPITIKIDAPLKVIGHANAVGSNAQTATARLASTIVASIQRSLAAAGDTAKARPLGVTVGCGVTIVGSKNIIGDEMAKALAAKATSLKPGTERNTGSQRSTATESRKRRAESEPPKVRGAKRLDVSEAIATRALS